MENILAKGFIHLQQCNNLIIHYLSNLPVFHHHFGNPTSELITLSLVYLLIFIVVYLLIRNILLHLGVIDLNADEQIFIDKPIHVAHLKANCVVLTDDDSHRLAYEIEFSPEDYDYEHDEELGTTLGLLKRKLYHLFKVSQYYKEAEIEGFTVDHVHVFHNSGRGLMEDDHALCLLHIQTGDTVRVLFDCKSQ